jgi:hypothetical protein
MTKSQLTSDQIELRSYFVNILSLTGWDAKGWEQLFENDVELSPEALLEFTNSDFWMRLGYFVDENYLRLEYKSKDEKIFLTVRFYPNELSELLETIVQNQHNFTIANHPSIIKKLIKVSRMAGVETEEGLMKLFAKGD